MKTLRRQLPYALLFSLPLSFCLVTGWQLETYDELTPGLPGVAFFLLLALILTPITAFLLEWRGKRAEETAADEALPAAEVVSGESRSESRKKFLLTWLVIALPNLLVLLGVFPGFFVYDAQDELTQVVTRSFTTHHPLIHVLTMGGTITGIHKVTGSWNAGIFGYLLLQMLFITGIYAYIVRRLAATKLPKPFRIAAILWYGLFPTIVMYNLCSTKDGLFSAFVTLMVLALTEKSTPRRQIPVLIFSMTLMMLYRNNACYALLACAGLVFFFCAIRWLRHRKAVGFNRKIFIACVIISYVIFMLSSSLMARLTQAYQREHQETITVAIQTLARAWKLHPEVFTEEDAAVLHEFLPDDGLDRYELRNADFVKFTFNNYRYESGGGDFWALYFRILPRCPMTFLNGWFLTCYGTWYPFAVNNVYAGHNVFTFTYTESSYFGYETEPPGERISLIPPIDALYRWLSLDATIQKIPVLSLLFAPAFYFWLYVFIAIRLLTQKRSADALPLLPLFFLWLTYLLGPVYLVRYALPFWTALPIVLARILPDHQASENIELSS